MASLIEAARAGEGTSFASLLFGLGDLHDVGGRPLGERRASSGAKVGCPMDLVPCPYPDERLDILMNVSALEPIKAELRGVHRDVSSFHAALPESIQGWDRMFIAVIDSLLGPGLFCLERASPELLISLHDAARYKLAAGFFEVMCRLQRERARGVARAPSLDVFMAYVHEQRALVGGGGHEACAGPPKLIRHTSGIYLGLEAEAHGPVDPRRVTVARGLHTELSLGIAWQCLDEAVERHFLETTSGNLRPKNDFMRKKLEARIGELGFAQPYTCGHASAALPRDLELSDREALEDAIHGVATALADPATQPCSLSGILARAEGAFEYVASSGVADALGAVFLRYLEARREFIRVTWQLERSMRAAWGGLTLDQPLVPANLLLPALGAFRWFEAMTGHRLSVELGPEPSMELVSRSARTPVFESPNARARGH